MTRIKELYVLKDKATKLANDKTARMHGVDYSYEVAGLLAELCHILLVAAGENPVQIAVVPLTGIVKMELEGYTAFIGAASFQMMIDGLETCILVSVEGHDPMWLVLRSKMPPIFGLDVAKPTP